MFGSLLLAAFAMVTLQATARAQPSVWDSSLLESGPDPDTGEIFEFFAFSWSSDSDGGEIPVGENWIDGGTSGPYEPCDCSGVTTDVMYGYYDFNYDFEWNDGSDWYTDLYWVLYEPDYVMMDCDSCPACNVSGVTPRNVNAIAWEPYGVVDDYETISVY